MDQYTRRIIGFGIQARVVNQQLAAHCECGFIKARKTTALVSAIQRERRSLSTPKGNSVQVAKRNAPPAAENTEKSRGAFTPNATAIVTPNKIRRIPLNRAAIRVCHPITRQRPNKASAQVEMNARAGITDSGKNQFSFPVYATNRAKLPQETLGWPTVPQSPKRSARAERKETPRASRKNSELNPLIRSMDQDFRCTVGKSKFGCEAAGSSISNYRAEQHICHNRSM